MLSELSSIPTSLPLKNHPHYGFTEVRATAFQTLYRITMLQSEMNFTHCSPLPTFAVYNLTVFHALWAPLLTVPSLESSEKVFMSCKAYSAP